MNYFLQNLLIFSIPLRELAGFKTGVPLRVGELLMVIYIGYIFLKTSMKEKFLFFNRTNISKNIVYLLGLNLLMTLVFSKNQAIETSFLYRYLSRNIMIFLFFISVLIKPIQLKEKNIDFFFKYMIFLQLFMLILQSSGFTIKLFSIESFPIFRRFQGTASEAGYLPTLIAPALWYFRNSIRNRKYYYIGIFEIFMTFSSFGYAVLVIEGSICVFTKKIRLSPKMILNRMLIIIFLTSIIAWNFKIISGVVEKHFVKIIKYSKNNGGDFSARARNQQLTFIKKEISKFNNEELSVGRGTGAYYLIQLKQIKKNTMMEITEEAHTIYYSTIHDRGILGFSTIVVISLLINYVFYKQRKDKVIMSIGYLYFLQLIHWKITGNMWLYYFWIGIAFIVSQYEIKEKRKIYMKGRKNGISKHNNAYI